MRHKKFNLSVITMALICATLVSGCGQAGATDEKTSLVDFHASGGDTAATAASGTTGAGIQMDKLERGDGPLRLHRADYTDKDIDSMKLAAKSQGIRMAYIPSEIADDDGHHRLMDVKGTHGVLVLTFSGMTVLNAYHVEDVRKSLEAPGQTLKLIQGDVVQLKNGASATWWKLPYTKGDSLKLLMLQLGETWVGIVTDISRLTNEPQVQAVAESLRPLK